MERLKGCRILIVEDESLIAEDVADLLRQPGAIVLGPVTTVETALALIDSEQDIDGAFLDVKLGTEMAFPVADALEVRQVPFVFFTGYDHSVIPERYERVPLLDKPIGFDDLGHMAISMCCARANSRMVVRPD